MLTPSPRIANSGTLPIGILNGLLRAVTGRSTARRQTGSHQAPARVDRAILALEIRLTDRGISRWISPRCQAPPAAVPRVTNDVSASIDRLCTVASARS